jgi:hypothetical protein
VRPAKLDRRRKRARPYRYKGRPAAQLSLDLDQKVRADRAPAPDLSKFAPPW